MRAAMRNQATPGVKAQTHKSTLATAKLLQDARICDFALLPLQDQQSDDCWRPTTETTTNTNRGKRKKLN
jgi:hypothetical protein|tara:strand:- start:714 stop:923 length:210 start_codon:yes stop_codon:yes gene_type:complete